MLNSNIVNVPLHDIATDLHASIASASLLVTVYGLTFGSLMPLGGWMGNRFGHRRMYCLGVSGIGIAAVVSASATNMPTLIVLRFVQGVSSAAVTPLVIVILSNLYPPADRPHAMSGWAAANGLGQALGPPLGGILASLLTWRAIFVPTPLIAAFACLATLRFVPADGEMPEIPLDWRGAISLTFGSFFTLAAISAIPQFGLSPMVGVLGAAGLLSIVAFVFATRRARFPFVSSSLGRDKTYVTSCLGVFGGTFSLGTVALGVPLYLTRSLHYSALVTGFIVLAFPLAQVVFARVSATFIRRTTSAIGLRIGLGIVMAGCAFVATVIQGQLSVIVLAVAIAIVGIGLSLVHTGSAVGSTATATGRFGAGVGLFNTIRLAGSTIGAAWVGITLQSPNGTYPQMFVASVLVAVVGLGATFLVRESAV